MSAQHAPAVKVAGRRLSTSNKSKPSAIIAPTLPAEAPTEAPASSPIDDYPRPSSHAHQERPHHHLDYAAYEEVHRPKVADPHVVRVQKPGDAVVSTTHEPLVKKDAGRGGRIAQPAGKSLGL